MANRMGPAAFMWPSDRAWSADQDNIAPCGSSEGPGNRTEFPLTGGRVALVAQDDSYMIQIALATSNDEGHTCVPVDDPPAGTQAGTNATLQIKYIADFDAPENQTFYACTDITYVASADFTTTIPCFNATEDSGATFNHTAPTSTAEADALDRALANEGKGGLSGGAIAGIVIGAVAGVALIVAALWIYRERKQKNRLIRQRDNVRQLKEDDMAAGGKSSTASQNSVELRNISNNA